MLPTGGKGSDHQPLYQFGDFAQIYWTALQITIFMLLFLLL